METTTTKPHDSHAAADHGDALAHPVSLRLLLIVYAALMICTALTYMATWVELGNFNIWLALLIAVIKAGLVAMYFMHLRWDSPFNGIVLIASLFFVALFVGSVILDAKEYRINYSPPVSNTTP